MASYLTLSSLYFWRQKPQNLFCSYIQSVFECWFIFFEVTEAFDFGLFMAAAWYNIAHIALEMFKKLLICSRYSIRSLYLAWLREKCFLLLRKAQKATQNSQCTFQTLQSCQLLPEAFHTAQMYHCTG